MFNCATAAGDVGDVVRKRDLCLRALAIYEGHIGSDADQLVPLLLMLAAAHGSIGDGVSCRSTSGRDFVVPACYFYKEVL